MIEIIARAIIIKDNKILLCKSNEQGHYFLPGGHVEFGESAEVTLVREMKEESNVKLSNMKFVGIFENTYGEGDKKAHEINILYTADVKDKNVTSKEPHISFEWVEIEKLREVEFLPPVFGEAIINFVRRRETMYLSTLK